MKKLQTAFAVVLVTSAMSFAGIQTPAANAGAACSGSDHDSPHTHWGERHKRTGWWPIWGGSGHAEQWTSTTWAGTNPVVFATINCYGATP